MSEKLKNTKNMTPKIDGHTAKQFISKIKNTVILPMKTDQNKKYFKAKEKAEAFNKVVLQFSNIDNTNAHLPNFQYKIEGRLSDISHRKTHTGDT